jgi:hypothetical protein
MHSTWEHAVTVLEPVVALFFLFSQETPTAAAGSDHDDDDNVVQIVTDDAAVTDTEAELAAEAHKAKMLSQLVKAAKQANYTSFMLVSARSHGCAQVLCVSVLHPTAAVSKYSVLCMLPSPVSVLYPKCCVSVLYPKCCVSVLYPKSCV